MCPSGCYIFLESFSLSSAAAMSRHDILRKERVTADKRRMDQHSGVQVLAKHYLFSVQT